MPEVRFQLEWPDGQSSTLYSPSTVILDYFRPGDSLLVSELEERGVEALRCGSTGERALDLARAAELELGVAAVLGKR